MAGRPKSFDESEALRAAMLVFWRRGYEDASCDELLFAMNLNAGSMYATFGDKRALFERAFDLYEREVFSKMIEVLQGDGTPLENVRTLVKCWEKAATDGKRRGCLVSSHLDRIRRLRRSDRRAGEIEDRPRSIGDCQTAASREAYGRTGHRSLTKRSRGHAYKHRSGTDRHDAGRCRTPSLSRDHSVDAFIALTCSDVHLDYQHS